MAAKLALHQMAHPTLVRPAVRRLVPGLLIAHLLLGVIYSFIVPVWEAHDETGHYPYVRYLVTQRALPPVDTKISRYFDEAHQPPLYYLLGAVASFWIDTGDFQAPESNPYAFDGTGLRGYNLFLHSGAEAFPWRGTLLAIHVVRLASVLVSTLAVWVTYRIARLLFPERDTWAVGATAVAAFSPLFLFIGSVVNNDALVPLWGGLALYFALKVVLDEPRPRWLILLGCCAGLAVLTKRTGLALFPFALGVTGLAELVVPVSGRTLWRRTLSFIQNSALALIPAVLIPSPWLLYNWRRYGTLLPDRVEGSDPRIFFDPSSGAIGASLTRNWIVDMVQYSFKTYWGAFGWGNVMLPDWVYLLLALLSLAGIAGVAGLLLSRPSRRKDLPPAPLPPCPPAPPPPRSPALWVCSWQIACVAALPLYRAAYWQAPDLVPGRYLLPVLPAISVLLVAGLGYWVPRQAESWTALVLGGGLATLAVIVPWGVIRPAYTQPVVSSNLHIANPIYLNFGDRLELLGYEIDRERVEPGGKLNVTLLWRAKSSLDRNYTIGVHVLGRDRRDLGQIDTYPGRGMYQTTLWRPGDAIRDTYVVRVTPDATVPALGRLSVGVSFAPDKESLPVTDTAGQPVTPVFGRFKIAAPGGPPVIVTHPVDFRLGDGVSLIGAGVSPASLRPGEKLSVSLTWQAHKQVEMDYAIFVHLIDTSGRELAPFTDWQPWGGEYPTGLWDPGEQVRDDVQLAIPPDLPPGAYRLVTGMYAPDTLIRLPATDASGNPLLHDLIPLATVQIEGVGR